MKIKEIPGKIAYAAVKEAASITAPLAALASTAGKGGDGYLDNLVAVYHVPEQIYHAGKAFVMNEGVRTFTFNRLGDLAQIVGNSAENIVKRPLETAVAAGIVYGAVKYSPHMIKGVIGLMRKSKTKSKV